MQVGDRFNSWEVVEVRVQDGKKHPSALCKCKCGTVKAVQHSNLRLNLSKQCQQCMVTNARKGLSKEEYDQKEREYHKQYNRKRYEEKKELLTAQHKEWRENNREKYNAKARIYVRRYAAKQNYGEFWEAAIILTQLEKELQNG